MLVRLRRDDSGERGLRSADPVVERFFKQRHATEIAMREVNPSPGLRGALSISCGPPSPLGDAWEYDAEYDLGHTPAAATAPHEAKDA